MAQGLVFVITSLVSLLHVNQVNLFPRIFFCVIKASNFN